MKKILILILALALSVFVLTSCSEILDIIIGDNTIDDGTADDWYDDNDHDYFPDLDQEDTKNEEEEEENKTENNPDNDNRYTYINFTSAEKKLIENFLGELIPFIPNNEYYLEEEYDDYYETDCLCFYTTGNTKADFEAYRALFTGYTLVDTFEDSFGDTWYCYEKGDIYIEMSYYVYDGEKCTDVYLYNLADTGSDDNGGGTIDPGSYTYTDFTSAEKQTIKNFLGELIPFVPNDEYVVEIDYDSYYEMDYLAFYTVGNTSSDFAAYRALFTGYTLTDTFEDSYGDTWYCYEKGDIYIEMSFYYYEGYYIIDLYAYNLGDDSGSGDSGNNGGSEGTYTDFTAAEKQTLIDFFGETFPFIPNSQYYLEKYEYEYTDSYEDGYNFYTIGNTQAEFNAYKALFSAYTYDGSDVDEYGDTWYYYTTSNGAYIDLSYYSDGSIYYVDVYFYFLYDSEGGDNGGNEGGENSGTTTPDGVMTNEGAGLPNGTNGVYNIDFTKAEYVKDVTDQGYYIDGCPTTGSPAVLVIPISFSDVSATSKGFSIQNIIRAFKGETDYYSVHDYYYISSYGQLDLDITVVNEWFVPRYSSSYYKNATYDYYGDQIAIGDQLILDEALAYLATFMDLSAFDSDNNGIIDAVVMVNSLEIGDDNFNWAYRYWNIYTDDDGYYYEYDGVTANDYMWMSYSFLHESYDNNGNVSYTDTSVLNTYTCIHEFGHILGVDDYYDTSYSDNSLLLDGCDIMDSMTGDHNAFSKFNLGWITSSRLVTTSSSVTLTLEAFSKNGDTIIIANNWDESLGAYQEYYIIVYYTNDGLNGGDYGYFARDGIVVYHVNASLYVEEHYGEIYYDIYNNNTDGSDYYGTEDNLIEFIKSSEGNFTYVEGDSMPSVKDDQGNTLSYTFTVDSLTEDQATITFTKR